MPDLTDQEWWDSLPPDAEFLLPAGFGDPSYKGGARCRPDVPTDESEPAPGPGYGLIDVWAGGQFWVPLAELRTWERYDPTS